MKFEKYYEKCSQEDLLDVLKHIDVDEHPEREAYVRALYERHGGIVKLNEERLENANANRRAPNSSLRLAGALVLFVITIVIFDSQFKVHVTLAPLNIDFFVGTLFLVAVSLLSVFCLLLYPSANSLPDTAEDAKP